MGDSRGEGESTQKEKGGEGVTRKKQAERKKGSRSYELAIRTTQPRQSQLKLAVEITEKGDTTYKGRKRGGQVQKDPKKREVGGTWFGQCNRD